MTKTTLITLALATPSALTAPARPVVDASHAAPAMRASPMPRVARIDDTKSLVAATQAYVVGLESKLAFGVFDETYVQSVEATLHDNHRTMTGELFLTHLPADDTWISVHDVATVDGDPVPGHQDLATMLQRGELHSVTRDVADHNALYNIGRIVRNFNEPTLPLLVLARSHISNFSFATQDVTDEQGTRLATLRFTEKNDVPTLISNDRGQHLRARGTITVEPETGRIHRTSFELSPPDMSVSLTTIYAHDASSGLWLPSVFQERYEGKPNGEHEVVTCEARYTNFRTFQVLGRIK
jgi:hypothetical protein